jgi:hypothetical protein
MSKTDKLSQLYKKAHTLNEDLPAQLIDKLSLYGQILEILGGLWADAIGEWKRAESKRREVIASATVYGAELSDAQKPKTAKEKEAIAEVVGATARQEESNAEMEAIRWKNAYNSVSEQIQIMKKRYEHLVNVSKGGI